MKSYYVYMVSNRSRVVLYTGVTNDLQRRLWQHVNGTNQGFTSRYQVNRLVYYEIYPDIRDAIAREKEIKAWRREKKNALVRTINPNWNDLGASLFGDLRTDQGGE
jgi:putative endonuclease